MLSAARAGRRPNGFASSLPASMIAVVTYFGSFGGPKKVYVSDPFIRDLLSEPGPKYFVMPSAEPAPAIGELPRFYRRGARPRAGGREVVALAE